MSWSYQNPVRIQFGVGAFDGTAAAIGGRPWALVTYGMDLFRELGDRIAGRAGAPVIVIDDIAANPDFADLEGICREFASAAPTVWRRNLPDELKQRIRKAFLDITDITWADQGKLNRFVETNDAAYDVIRETAKVLNLDLKKMK